MYTPEAPLRASCVSLREEQWDFLRLKAKERDSSISIGLRNAIKALIEAEARSQKKKAGKAA
jgi:hypothetical protein